MTVSSGAGFDPRKEPAVSPGPQPHPEPSPEGLHQRTDNPGPSNHTVVERVAVVQWHYVCTRCGHRTVSTSPHLVTCPIPWDNSGHHDPAGEPCGARFEDYPMANYHDLMTAGLLVTDDELATREFLARIDEEVDPEAVDRVIRIGQTSKAVVDAAVAWKRQVDKPGSLPGEDGMALLTLAFAVDAYLAARGEEQ